MGPGSVGGQVGARVSPPAATCGVQLQVMPPVF